jgi:hypothetical protein
MLRCSRASTGWVDLGVGREDPGVGRADQAKDDTEEVGMTDPAE